MRLGKGIDLTLVTPSIFLFGSATGTWTAADATHGTYVAHHGAGAACGGTDYSLVANAVDIKCRGCGSIKVTISGNGSANNGFPVATASVITPLSTTSAQGTLSLHGPGGGAACGSGALTNTSGIFIRTFRVTCGSTLRLQYQSTFNHNSPALDCTFTIQVMS